MSCGDLVQYVTQLKTTNRHLSKTVKLQISTITTLQERNEQLVDALVMAIKELDRQGADNPIAHILRAVL